MITSTIPFAFEFKCFEIATNLPKILSKTTIGNQSIFFLSFKSCVHFPTRKFFSWIKWICFISKAPSFLYLTRISRELRHKLVTSHYIWANGIDTKRYHFITHLISANNIWTDWGFTFNFHLIHLSLALTEIHW